MHIDCGERPFSGPDSGYTFKDMAVFSAIEFCIKGLSYSARAVFNAAGVNEVAQSIDYSRDRIFAFGHKFEDWPALPVV